MADPLELCDVLEGCLPVPFLWCDWGTTPILSCTGFFCTSGAGCTIASFAVSFTGGVKTTLLGGEICAGIGVGDLGLRPLSSPLDASVEARLRVGGVVVDDDDEDEEDDEVWRFFFLDFSLFFMCSRDVFNRPFLLFLHTNGDRTSITWHFSTR